MTDKEQFADLPHVQLLTDHQLAIRAYVGSLLPMVAEADDVIQQTNLVLWNKRADLNCWRTASRSGGQKRARTQEACTVCGSGLSGGKRLCAAHGGGINPRRKHVGPGLAQGFALDECHLAADTDTTWAQHCAKCACFGQKSRT